MDTWLILTIVGLVIAAIFLVQRTTGKTMANSDDLLAEAEVYLAYGRKAQAIEVLEEALKVDPGNAAISAKLGSIKENR